MRVKRHITEPDTLEIRMAQVYVDLTSVVEEASKYFVPEDIVKKVVEVLKKD